MIHSKNKHTHLNLKGIYQYTCPGCHYIDDSFKHTKYTKTKSCIKITK